MPNVVVFPFDLFGGGGTGAGAKLLGDAVHEILDDTERETRPCRADVLRGKVRVKELPFDTIAETADWRNRGRLAARQALKNKDFLLWLGGNHLSALPILEELGEETLVVQFDAHLDVYKFHDTTEELSNGNYLNHFESPRPRLVNIGHRDLFLSQEEIDQTFEQVLPAWEIARDATRVAEELHAKAANAKRVWIDLDCDALDPAVMPAVPEPVPIGLMPAEFLKLFDALWAGKVLGLSISEFDPGRDVRDAGLNLLGWLAEYTLLKAAER